MPSEVKISPISPLIIFIPKAKINNKILLASLKDGMEILKKLKYI